MSSDSPANRMDRVLRFWHQVEFFIPFDLQQQVLENSDAEYTVRLLSKRDLVSSRLSLWQPRVQNGHELTGFDIYFGIFDKSLLSEIVGAVLRSELPRAENFEEEQRAELEGSTCIAKIRADSKGQPFFENISVSTAPWALGRIQEDGLSRLDFENFKSSVEHLKQKLVYWRAETQNSNEALENGSRTATASLAGVAPLTGHDLLRLLEIFEEWCAFSHSNYANNSGPVVVVQTRSRKKRKTRDASNSLDARPESDNGRTDDDEADEDAKAEGDDGVQVDILNSFYAADIANVIDSLRHGQQSPALSEYLNPLPQASRLDLYQPQGWGHIQRMLAPEFLTRGHWPSEPFHRMYLMQQFAINCMFQKLEMGGLFSVNGPPGTGKTTLLRDAFAEIIVRRARVLAGLANAREAFHPASLSVGFRQAQSCQVSRLREDLTGFEIVVASSNNAAVENISKDIPKAKSLGEKTWRDARGIPKFSYLQEVAHNLAARKSNGDYEPLEIGDLPWGLAACALGNRGNRRKFASGLCGNFSKDKPSPKGYDPKQHQSIWAWRSAYEGPSFTQAQDVFRQAEAAVNDRLKKLQSHAEIEIKLGGKNRETYCADKIAALGEAEVALNAACAALECIKFELGLCEKQLASLREEAGLIRQRFPAKWVLWFLRKRRRQLEAEMDAVHQQQRSWLQRQRDANSRQQPLRQDRLAAEQARTQAQEDLAVLQREWQVLYDAWAQSSQDFVDAKCPASPAELETDDWQIGGLWHDTTLNCLRSELFIAALALHEAWLAEVLKKNGGFGGNLVAIDRLLNGKRLLRPENALAIWQSLFMVVPVVSSTFASIANQFKELEAQSLGWLFIDEAGQAVPQAAVGALWRAKRAVVVGDPLQIEPVFTVPIRLIEMLARSGGLLPDSGVEPHQVSVQNIADGANRLGAHVEVNSQTQWIGSPLRVHRRCVDPMFSIANTIAYQGKMVFFDPALPVPRLPAADSLNLGASCWIKMGGEAKDKQVVAAQIEFACQVVMALFKRDRQLPRLYIISPFRRIKQAISTVLRNFENWPVNEPSPKKDDLRKWCNEHIGTVHTFQGKEESAVLMVLGCDSRTEGAAAWAASKPNLLNVALTRAKHRFFMLGDEEIWSKLPYFSEANAQWLPRVESEQFLAALDMTHSAL